MQALGNPCRNVRGRCGTHREGLVARCGTRGGAESARGVFRHWFGAGYHILLLPGNPLRHTSAQLPRCRYVAGERGSERVTTSSYRGRTWYPAAEHVLAPWRACSGQTANADITATRHKTQARELASARLSAGPG